MLKVNNAVKQFNGFNAVDDCSIQVRQNTVTGLIGPNGAGKTTMFNLISGSLKLDSGEVWFNEQRVDKLGAHRVASMGLSRTFQIPRALQKMTVLENLMLVPAGQSGEKVWNSWFKPGKVLEQEKEILEKAYQILDFLEISHVAKVLAGNLSVGQKKLLELGRALMADPEMILLDEPGAGVNPTLLNKISKNILALKEKGKTILLIEHNMDLVMNICENVIVMSDGKHLVEGTPEEIRKNPLVLEAYLGDHAARDVVV